MQMKYRGVRTNLPRRLSFQFTVVRSFESKSRADRIDYRLEWTLESNSPGLRAQSPGVEVEPDPNPITFVEAVRDQLGLKLQSTKAPVQTLVIDHIERPSEN